MQWGPRRNPVTPWLHVICWASLWEEESSQAISTSSSPAFRLSPQHKVVPILPGSVLSARHALFLQHWPHVSLLPMATARGLTTFKKKDGTLELTRDIITWTPAVPPSSPPTVTIQVGSIESPQPRPLAPSPSPSPSPLCGGAAGRNRIDLWFVEQTCKRRRHHLPK